MQTQLDKRKVCGTFRKLSTIRNRIDFASNDYLGLARCPKLKERIIEEWKAMPNTLIGSTGSRLLTGNNAYVQGIEEHIAGFHHSEAGLLFNCGYMANQGLATAIGEIDDLFLFDAHIHASLRESIRMSRAQAFPFRHNDLTQLEHRLKRRPAKGSTFICIESIYSTDGSVAPLEEIFQLSQKYDAKLIVDEAHAVGIFGPQGKGLVAKHGLSGKIFAHVIPFGKALGVFGAIILGDTCLKEMLINFARSFIYTTALPFHCLAAIKCSYEMFPLLESKRKHLFALIQEVCFSKTPIQPIFVSGNDKALDLVKAIASKGFDVRALLSPTVQRGKELLRLCLHAFNTTEEVRELLGVLRLYV